MPNNARDLLPMMQPATKALAQMLSGRVPRSGQLGHAQAIAAQADRLISERAHNRLNPSEREEFFEQIARLKLTLADAQAEAEEQGVQEPVVKAAPRQLAQARLKEMALALAGPERARPSDAPADEAAGRVAAAERPSEPEPDAATGEARGAEREAEQAERVENGADPEAAESAAEAPAGRLQLSGAAAREAADALSDDERNARASRRAQATRRKTATTSSDKRPGGEPARESDGEAQAAERSRETVADVEEGDVAAREEHGQPADGQGRSASARRAPRRHKQKGVPEGWVIDDEGYVVPGPG